ncbi:MAG: TlpA disulfide reductase family protein [Pseudomonadota bacterium]
MHRTLILLIPALLLAGVATAAPVGGMPPGKKAPGFNLNVLGGGDDTTVRLSDLVGKRPKEKVRLVLVSFFATWCKPCMAEMPILQAIHETLGPKGVKVLSVVVEGADERPQKEILKEVMGWTRENGVTFPVLYDPFLKDVVAKRYLGQSMELPGVYLVDTEGRIKAVWHEKRDDLETLVEAYLQ